MHMSPISAALVAAICCVVPTKSDEPPLDFRELSRQARNLLPMEAAELETDLVLSPDDVRTRTLLTAYYFRRQFQLSGDELRAYRNHAIWWIEERPDADRMIFLYTSQPLVDDLDSRALATALWKKRISDCTDVVVLRNSYEFFRWTDATQAGEILRKLHLLEPDNPMAACELGQHLIEVPVLPGSESRKDAAARALKLARHALTLDPKPYERDKIIGLAARAAYKSDDLDATVEYASDMIDRAVLRSHLWNPSYVSAIHDGHTLLGLVAIKRGDIDKAKEHLLSSGQSINAPDLVSFGPNMDLALELLQHKQPECVIEYLRTCSKLWHSEDVDRWIGEIEQGRVPWVRANLRM